MVVCDVHMCSTIVACEIEEEPGGIKTTLVPEVFAMDWRVSKYRICIAAWVLKMSEASLMSLAASTSACKELNETRDWKDVHEQQ